MEKENRGSKFIPSGQLDGGDLRTESRPLLLRGVSDLISLPSALLFASSSSPRGIGFLTSIRDIELDRHTID